MNAKLVSKKSWRTGPSVSDKQYHRLEFDCPVTPIGVRAYAESHDWFGYAPAGYGDWHFEPLNPVLVNGIVEAAHVWVASHAASCD